MLTYIYNTGLAERVVHPSKLRRIAKQSSDRWGGEGYCQSTIAGWETTGMRIAFRDLGIGAAGGEAGERNGIASAHTCFVGGLQSPRVVWKGVVLI